MTTAPAVEIRNQLEEKALEYLDLKDQLNTLREELQVVRERAERLQQRLAEGETNDYNVRCREIEYEIFYTKSAIIEASIAIETLRRQLRILTGEHIHFRPSFE